MVKRLKKVLFALFGCSSLLLSGCFFDNKITAELNCSECVLQVGSGKQLSIKSVTNGLGLIPTTNYSYTWTSSNVDVVKVSSSGYVSSVDAGNAVVSANIKVNGKSDIIRANCNFLVTDPNPITLTLNKTEAEIQQGKSLQLTANVEHTANKKVFWTSNNPNFEVDNTGFVSTKKDVEIGSTATITATSVANSSIKATCELTVIPQVPTSLDYTIMLYMSGSTLEYDTEEADPNIGLFSEDIEEILSVDLPESVKVIIETGGAKKWNLKSNHILGATSISSYRLQRWEVVNHKIQLVESLNTNYMYEESSFESFLKWGLSDYEATQMGVIISGHGAGIGGCAPDDNNNMRPLAISDIVEASSNSLKSFDREKFTWLGFDCCMMQCADVASVMSDYYGYMVASQQSELGNGWDHDVYLKELVADPTILPEDLLSYVANSFVNQFHKNRESTPCYQTMSVLDLSKMDTFVTNVNSYIESVGVDKYAYNNYYLKAMKISENSFGDSCYGLVDFADYVKNITYYKPSVSCKSVLDSLNDLVVTNVYCNKYEIKPCGLNAFLPETMSTKNKLQVTRTDYFGNVTKFNDYQSMCLSYGHFYDSW